MNRKRSKPKIDRRMPMVHPNAAAIDVGATMHMAAVRAERTPEPVRSFGTFTTDLHRLVNWFKECGVETVVMESTSVYWIPIFELLDARGFTVFLVNARDAKHVPGRKTDVSDAQWLQRLHSFGLLRARFRPKGQIAELRAYVRQRERLLEYAASHIQHMQKALTQMNLQLHHVVADITGVTGVQIIRAILAGERDPKVLARLRHYNCHSSAETIEKALTGSYRAEHLFALEQARARRCAGGWPKTVSSPGARICGAFPGSMANMPPVWKTCSTSMPKRLIPGTPKHMPTPVGPISARLSWALIHSPSTSFWNRARSRPRGLPS